MRKKRAARKKIFFISLIAVAIVFATLFTGYKVYTYASAPKITGPKVDEVAKDNAPEKKNPGKSSNDNIPIAFQDGKEVETTVSQNVTKTGQLPKHEASKEKVAYLTFDDGPTSNITPAILDTLKANNVKATFFVLGKMAEVHPDILKRIYNEGHLIANHSYSHDYKYLYSSVDNFLSDMKKSEAAINKILGTDGLVQCIRFPGGSFSKKLNPYKEAAVKEGYYYFDWNCLNGDAEGGKKTEDQLVNKVIETSKGKNEIIILMHDSTTKQATANSLGKVIENLKSEGYKFDTLDNYYK